jgi:hypothetical protein
VYFTVRLFSYNPYVRDLQIMGACVVVGTEPRSESIEHKKFLNQSSIPSPTTMSTIEIVKEAIGALKDRTGSSVIAMNKWIETEKKVSRFEPSTARSHFRGRIENTFFLAIFRRRPKMASAISRHTFRLWPTYHLISITMNLTDHKGAGSGLSLYIGVDTAGYIFTILLRQIA